MPSCVLKNSICAVPMRMVRAHLHHEKVGVGRTFQNRDREPEIVVVVAVGRVRPALLPQERRRELLHRRLAGAPRDADDLRLQGLAVVARRLRERRLHVRHRNERRLLRPRELRRAVRTHQKPLRTFLKRLSDEAMAIDRRTGQRREKAPRPHLAGIEHHPRILGRAERHHALAAFIFAATSSMRVLRSAKVTSVEYTSL